MFLTTQLAAKYCTERGRKISAAHLRRLRQRGEQDPGEKGPAWVRNPANDWVLYDTDALDRWIAAWKEGLEARHIQAPQRLQPAA